MTIQVLYVLLPVWIPRVLLRRPGVGDFQLSHHLAGPEFIFKFLFRFSSALYDFVAGLIRFVPDLLL